MLIDLEEFSLHITYEYIRVSKTTTTKKYYNFIKK